MKVSSSIGLQSSSWSGEPELYEVGELLEHPGRGFIIYGGGGATQSEADTIAVVIFTLDSGETIGSGIYWDVYTKPTNDETIAYLDMKIDLKPKFTCLKVICWGWFHLSTVLDDFSRYIVAWKLCTTMKAADVTATLERALQASGLNKARVVHRPRLLSDNGSSYISDDLAKWLERHDMNHVRGAPYHPMTQGKIERWHQTLKNRILLENYYLPGDLEAQIEAFVADYNTATTKASVI